MLLKKNISFQDEKLSLKEKVKKLLALRFIFSIKKKKSPLKQVSTTGQMGMDWASFSSCGYLEKVEHSLGGALGGFLEAPLSHELHTCLVSLGSESYMYDGNNQLLPFDGVRI